MPHDRPPVFPRATNPTRGVRAPRPRLTPFSPRRDARALAPAFPSTPGEDPLCYLLEMDGRKILLDCGWDDRMDVQALEPLRRIAPHVDAVLISHPDTAHLGALPYAFGTLGMACKVYATLPVHKMGMMFMYDQFLARAAEGDFDLFSLDDVDRAFGAFVPVRYAQHSALDFPTRNANGADGGDGASGDARGDARGDGSDGSGANDANDANGANDENASSAFERKQDGRDRG